MIAAFFKKKNELTWLSIFSNNGKYIFCCAENSYFFVLLIRMFSCTIPEVNHLKYEKMAEAAGLTYVYSNMEEGTLVLAKLTGFTSWPAVICNDPGKYHNLDYWCIKSV